MLILRSLDAPGRGSFSRAKSETVQHDAVTVSRELRRNGVMQMQTATLLRLLNDPLRNRHIGRA